MRSGFLRAECEENLSNGESVLGMAYNQSGHRECQFGDV